MEKYENLDEDIGIEVLKKGIIYHYTSVEGVLGILDKSEFWVTKSDFLNDISEINYTFDLFEENFLNKIKNENVRTRMISQFHSELDKDRALYNKALLGTYIISFSTNQDNLLLWSEFAGKMGYNLGFNIEYLKDEFNRKSVKDEKYLLKLHGKVIYNKEEQIRLLGNRIDWKLISDSSDKNMNSLENLNESISDEIIEDFISGIFFHCLYYSMFFKDSKFEQEEEYRFIFQASHNSKKVSINKEMNFRVKEGALCPFVKVPFKCLNSLESITIGPKNNIDIAKKGLENYCRNKEINPKILKSNIPLRY